jgi:Family of unknown function (DUF6132)
LPPGETGKESEMTSAWILRALIGSALGGAAGFAYYRFVGCSTGSCPLTSNPWITTLYGAAMGTMFAVK